MPLSAIHAGELHFGRNLRVKFAAKIERHIKIAQLADRQRQAHFHDIGVEQDGNILRPVGVLAEFHLARLHDGVERRPHFGPLQVDAGLPELGFQLADAGGGDIGQALGVLDLRLARQPALAEFEQALVFGAGVGFLGFRLGQGGFAAGQRDLVVAAVEAQQSLGLGNITAGFQFRRYPGHGAGNRRRQVHGARGLHLALGLHEKLGRFGADFHDPHSDGNYFRRGRVEFGRIAD